MASHLTGVTTYPISEATARQPVRPLFGHVIARDAGAALDGATMPVKLSGHGRALAAGALEELTEIKCAWMKVDA